MSDQDLPEQSRAILDNFLARNLESKTDGEESSAPQSGSGPGVAQALRRVDRYGVSRRDLSSRTHYTFLLPENAPEPKPRGREAERRLKEEWRKRYDVYGARPANCAITLRSEDYQKLRGPVRKGLAPAYRSLFWPLLLNSENLYEQNEQNTDEPQYAVLLATPVDEAVDVQIAKDITRTFPEAQQFSNVDDDSSLRALFRVLRAYSSHNEAVRYCQGMNFIAATFLMFLEERKAYWAFYRYMVRFGDLYSSSLTGCLVRAKVLDRLLQQCLPEVRAYLERAQIDLLLLVPKWFMTAFSSTLGFSVYIRVFDSILCEGDKMFYRAAMGILSLASRGKRMPAPTGAALASLVERYGEWTGELGSQAYTVYFEQWASQPENKGKVSLLCMPTEFAMMYLSNITWYYTDPDAFMRACIAIKFSTQFMKECEKAVLEEMGPGGTLQKRMKRAKGQKQVREEGSLPAGGGEGRGAGDGGSGEGDGPIGAQTGARSGPGEEAKEPEGLESPEGAGDSPLSPNRAERQELAADAPAAPGSAAKAPDASPLNQSESLPLGASADASDEALDGELPSAPAALPQAAPGAQDPGPQI